MTCIVALAANGGVYLAGGAAYGNSGWRDTLAWPKVWTATLADGTPFGVGTAGNPRISQVLRYCVDWSDVEPPDSDVIGWLVRLVVPLMRATLEEHGVAHYKDEPGRLDGSMVVAVAGQVVRIESHWQVMQTVHDWIATGCCSEAEGVMFATDRLPASRPAHRLNLALEAASALNDVVGPPFTVLFVPAKVEQ